MTLVARRPVATPRSAATLFLSEATVKTYVSRLLTKLDLRDRVQLDRAGLRDRAGGPGRLTDPRPGGPGRESSSGWMRPAVPAGRIRAVAARGGSPGGGSHEHSSRLLGRGGDRGRGSRHRGGGQRGVRQRAPLLHPDVEPDRPGVEPTGWSCHGRAGAPRSRPATSPGARARSTPATRRCEEAGLPGRPSRSSDEHDHRRPQGHRPDEPQRGQRSGAWSTSARARRGAGRGGRDLDRRRGGVRLRLTPRGAAPPPVVGGSADSETCGPPETLDGVSRPTRTDVLVVGAGPAGSAAAAWSARAGLDTLLVDAAVFPRDKTCGDGLTPRAIGELERLGLGDWLRAHTVSQGLRAHGFGQTLLLPWPGRHAARLGLRGRPHRARRPPAHHRDQGGRRRARRRPRGRRTPRRRPGRRRGAPRRRRRLRGRLRAAGRGRRRPLAAGQAAGPRVAPRHRLRRGRPGLRRLHRRPTTRGSAPTSSCGARTARSSPATAGSSRSATARSTSAPARSRPPKRPAEVAIKPLMQLYADTIRDDFGLSGGAADADLGAAADGRRGLPRRRAATGR